MLADESHDQLFLGDQQEFENFEDDIEQMNKAARQGTVYRKRKSQRAQALEQDQTK